MDDNQRSGVVIGATGGLVFVLINAGEQSAPVGLALRTTGVLLYLAVLATLLHGSQRTDGESPPRPRYTRGYWLVVAVEVALGLGGVRVVPGLVDMPEAGVTWIALIVGLHLVALAAVWREAPVAVSGVVVAVLGLAGLVLAGSGASVAAVTLVGGVLPGFVLLVGGAAAALESRRQESGTAV